MKTNTKKTLFNFIKPYTKWLIICSLCSFMLILFISDPINKLSSLISSIRKLNVAFNRIDEILSLPVECTLDSISSSKQV